MLPMMLLFLIFNSKNVFHQLCFMPNIIIWLIHKQNASCKDSQIMHKVLLSKYWYFMDQFFIWNWKRLLANLADIHVWWHTSAGIESNKIWISLGTWRAYYFLILEAITCTTCTSNSFRSSREDLKPTMED